MLDDAVMISIYPLCPSKLDKHEPAAILLNQLMQKRMNVRDATIKIKTTTVGEFAA
jgi:hypothetical protein